MKNLLFLVAIVLLSNFASAQGVPVDDTITSTEITVQESDTLKIEEMYFSQNTLFVPLCDDMTQEDLRVLSKNLGAVIKTGLSQKEKALPEQEKRLLVLNIQTALLRELIRR